MRNGVYIFALLCALSCSVSASSDLDKLAQPILDAVSSGATGKIASLVFPVGSPSRSYISSADLKRLDSQFETSFDTVGQSYGYSLYHEADIPGVYAIRYYVFRFERQPVLLKFEFYKPKEKWEIHGFEIDDELDTYMENAAQYRIGNLGARDIRSKIEKINKGNQNDK